MNKKAKGFIGALLTMAAAIGAVAGAIAVLYKVVKKHLKFTVEVLPEEEIEDENALTAAVDVVDIDIPEEEKAAEPEIEISFTEEENEEEA